MLPRAVKVRFDGSIDADDLAVAARRVKRAGVLAVVRTRRGTTPSKVRS